MKQQLQTVRDALEAITNKKEEFGTTRFMAHECITILDAVIEGMGWRPIETAPKDGTPIIVWGADVSSLMGGFCARCWWSQGHKKWMIYDDEIRPIFLDSSVMYWIPFPQPPASSNQRDNG